MKNISKIISIAFLSFSILLLCYVFYRSQVFYNGTKFDHYFKYYVIAFLFTIFSFISFFIQRDLKINITIVFISVLIGLYFVEGYLIIQRDTYRISKQERKVDPAIYKSKTGKDYDERSIFEIYQDLKKEDPNVVISLHGMSLSDDNSIYFSLSGLIPIHCKD